MFRKLFILALLLLTSALGMNAQTLWLDQVQVSLFETSWGETKSNMSVEGRQLSVGGQTYQRGVGTHAVSKIMFSLEGKSLRFKALVGVDDEAGEQAAVEFHVLGDSKVLWSSGLMKRGEPARAVDVDLKGLQKLALLVTNGGDGIHSDHADWLEASIEYQQTAPRVHRTKAPRPYRLTPTVSSSPSINYPRVTAARPGHPFLFSLPVTGEGPLHYEVEGLPEGLSLDKTRGVIKGTTPPAGSYPLVVKVSNRHGSTQANLTISSGEKIAMTPPMGWNSWNCWGLSVDEPKTKAAAQVMAEKLRGHGWTYVNVDDGWQAQARDGKGVLPGNSKFPDMKALADYIHGLGLKMGLYSSPGEKTCGAYLGSFGHEQTDAATYARWGVDFLKYDWCSYAKIAPDPTDQQLRQPYLLMREALRKQNRDVVYSICQYGMGKPWEWAESAGGNLWRSTGDISDTWPSMAHIGFSQNIPASFAKPGAWNDPDMLVIGKLGWGPQTKNTRLTADEQYTHMSLWCLLQAPLLLGCDLSQLDDFTLNLITNNEVIALNQDSKGSPARRLNREGENEIWVKNLADGSIVVGLFYTRAAGEGAVSEFQWEDEPKPLKMVVNWGKLGINGAYLARDLWRQKDLGLYHEFIAAEVPWHGAALIRLSPQ